MALTVKSRRAAASASLRLGSGWTAKPRWPAPVFDSRRGRLKSYSAPLSALRTLMTPKLRPITSVAPKGARARWSDSKSTPATSTSRSLDSRPRSQSRTPPPTSRGRPARRTASSMPRRSGGRGNSDVIFRRGRQRGADEEDPARQQGETSEGRDRTQPTGAAQGEEVEGAGEQDRARHPAAHDPDRSPGGGPGGSRPEPARETEQGQGVDEVEMH